MSKITTLAGAALYSQKTLKLGKKVGLVVGSFDVLHLGHINLFRFAKRYCDILIVGLDSDETIKLVKGKERPINNYYLRSQFLSEIISVDKVFLIKPVSFHGSEKARSCYEDLVKKIKPTHLFSHETCDLYWKSKQKIAKKYKAKFYLDNSEKVTNSGSILKKLMKEM